MNINSKNLSMKNSIKLIIGLVGVCFIGAFTSCDLTNYTQETEIEFNAMKPPVIMFAKSKSLGEYRVTLIDGEGKLHHFGNVSTLANSLGETFKIGDTLK